MLTEGTRSQLRAELKAGIGPHHPSELVIAECGIEYPGGYAQEGLCAVTSHYIRYIHKVNGEVQLRCWPKSEVHAVEHVHDILKEQIQLHTVHGPVVLKQLLDSPRVFTALLDLGYNLSNSFIASTPAEESSSERMESTPPLLEQKQKHSPFLAIALAAGFLVLTSTLAMGIMGGVVLYRAFSLQKKITAQHRRSAQPQPKLQPIQAPRLPASNP